MAMKVMAKPTNTSNATAPATAARTMIRTEKFTADSLLRRR